MLYVVAGNYQQFRGYCHARDINPREACYVSQEHTLAGIARGSYAIMTGTYSDRRDLPEIKERLMIAQADVRYDPY